VVKIPSGANAKPWTSRHTSSEDFTAVTPGQLECPV
jgi:hypothetical protein